jgi:multicomponent Na+:H+ antiporter subunit D
MNFLLSAPILIPFLTAISMLLWWRSIRVQRWLNLVGSASLLCVSIALLMRVSANGIQTVQIGGWPAPFGITLVADLFSAIMTVLAGMMGFAIAIYSLSSIGRSLESLGYYPLYHVLLMGVCGAFLTGDIFNLYVWFEVLLMASFALLSIGGGRQQVEGAIKYVTLNLVASAMLLSAIGILYASAGTLNMADLSERLASSNMTGIRAGVAMLFLVAFGIKSAVFPLFFWLPASYHTPPAAVSAIFSSLLTKVGVYCLIRVFTLLFVKESYFTHTLILWIAAFTMVTGVFGAMAQNEFRRILSFHIVSQIGYIIMGLGVFTPLALAGSIYFIIHNITAKANLFLVSGVVERIRGTSELKRLGGVYSSHPWLAVFFLISAFSLAGMPPLSGFFAKFALIQAGVGVEQYMIAATALIVGFFTLFSMMKIWMQAFWRPAPESTAQESAAGIGMWAPVAALAVLSLVIGLAVQPVFSLAQRASEQLMDPAIYVEAVLGGNR